MANAIALSSQNFSEEVESASVPVLVDFWAPWCGPCQQLGPILDQVAAELGSEAKITKVNTEDEASLAARFGVQALPTLLFFKDGEVKDQLVGLQGKETIAGKLRALAS